ncbi:MAG: glyceraldehyde 3-phosphate dehydrogenase NAD-binding domain-containing protein, partial [Cyanobacteria bacterium J06649_11]
MVRVAINGFGRIGLNFVRCLLTRGADTNLELVGLNDTSDPKTNAHLLKYDTMLGVLDADIGYDTNSLIVNGKTIKCVSDRNPLNLPWKEWDIDIIIESTGVFRDAPGAGKHLQAGAKKVVITAPGSGPDIGTYVMGVNHEKYTPGEFDIVSNASCTTNCLAPIVKVINENFGI